MWALIMSLSIAGEPVDLRPAKYGTQAECIAARDRWLASVQRVGGAVGAAECRRATSAAVK